MKKKPLAISSAALAASLFALSSVYADDYPGTNTGAFLGFPDPGPHTACWIPNPNTGTIPGPIWQHLFNYMSTTLNSQTGVTVGWTTDTSTTTDMRLDDRLADPTLYGLQQCVNIHGNECWGSDVFINTTQINTDATNASLNPATVQQFNWCHEGGHSLGFGHTAGCMQTGLRVDVSYSSHSRTHLDPEF